MTATLRRLLDLSGAPRLRVASSVLLGALTVLFGVGLMTTAGYLISRAAEEPAILSLTTAIAAVRFFALARPLTRYLERLASHDLSLRALGRVRVGVYERIEPLAPGQLEAYRHGDLLSRMVADVDALQGLHVRVVCPPIVALLAGAVSVGVAAAVLPAAAVVIACGLLVAGVIVPAVSAFSGRRTGDRQAAARGALTAELVDLLRAAPELAIYGAREHRLDRVREADGELVAVTKRDALAGGLGEGLWLVVAGLTVAGVLTLAVAAHAAGDLDRTLVAALTLLALASFEAVQPLSTAARELSTTVASGRRLLDLLDREPAVLDPAEPAPSPQTFAIALEGVAARYSPDEPRVLDGVDFRLEPGARIAILGPSGAGKTTITNLLLRFLDPEEGRITLGGRDLREYRQEDVRRTIAVAGQDSHIFSTSIRENVRLGGSEASDADIEAALRRARLWDWVEKLPEGWDTVVGEEGGELSGGQRQRLVVARALLADAPVLVLDEPTAHLDAQTAEGLVRDVIGAAGERSVLLMTHRPEGLDLMDDVLVLEHGRVASLDTS